MRIAICLGAALWAGSWYVMYLEITRWHHVTPTLAFNPPVIPGTNIHPKSGMPLKLLYVTCAAAPGFVTTAVIKQTRTRRTQQ